MYQKITKQIRVGNELHTVGATLIDKNRYIYSGLNNVYVQTAANMYLLTEYPQFMKLYTNTAPYSSKNEWQQHYRVYHGTFNENSSFVVYCSVPFSYVCGMALPAATNIAHIDTDTKILTSPTDEVTNCVFNVNNIINVISKPSTTGSILLYCHGAVIEQEFDAVSTDLVHTVQYSDRRHLCRVLNSGAIDHVQYYTAASGNLEAYKLLQLNTTRILFTPDKGDTWYTHNGITFVSFIPGSTYVSLQEVEANGVTFNDYEQISVSQFVTFFGEAASTLRIITNGWPLARCVRAEHYRTQLTSEHFIYQNTSNNYNVTAIAGVI